MERRKFMQALLAIPGAALLLPIAKKLGRDNGSSNTPTLNQPFTATGAAISITSMGLFGAPGVLLFEKSFTPPINIQAGDTLKVDWNFKDNPVDILAMREAEKKNVVFKSGYRWLDSKYLEKKYPNEKDSFSNLL